MSYISKSALPRTIRRFLCFRQDNRNNTVGDIRKGVHATARGSCRSDCRIGWRIIHKLPRLQICLSNALVIASLSKVRNPGKIPLNQPKPRLLCCCDSTSTQNTLHIIGKSNGLLNIHFTDHAVPHNSYHL